MAEKIIAPRGVNPQLPIHQAITAKNMLAAAGGDWHQKKRIRAWKRINDSIFSTGGTLLPRPQKAPIPKIHHRQDNQNEHEKN